MTAGLRCSREALAGGGRRGVSDGGGCSVPFPLCCRGIGPDPERVLAELPGLRGVAGEGTAGLQLILGGGQSLMGSSRLEGGVALAPRCPRASTASAGVTLALKMLPWAGEGALRCQPGFLL